MLATVQTKTTCSHVQATSDTRQQVSHCSFKASNTCSRALLIHSVRLVSSLSKGAPFSMTYMGTSSWEAHAIALYRLWGSIGYPMSASSTLLNLLLGENFQSTTPLHHSIANHCCMCCATSRAMQIMRVLVQTGLAPCSMA